MTLISAKASEPPNSPKNSTLARNLKTRSLLNKPALKSITNQNKERVPDVSPGRLKRSRRDERVIAHLERVAVQTGLVQNKQAFEAS
jgi:hypothetical protein